MHVYDDVVLAVYCAVLAVVEPVRLPVTALLPAVWIGQALHLLLGPASWRWIVVPVKRLLAQYFPVQVYLGI